MSGLRRILGWKGGAWLVAGNMIGAGIFITPGFVAADLPGIGWPLVAWILGGLLALAGAAVYAELGTRLPRAGADYQYLSQGFGPLWGFLTGWAGWALTFSAAAAAICKSSVEHLWTALAPGEPLPWLAQVVLPPLLVLALTAANVAGVRFGGAMTAVLTAVPLVGLVALFGVGLLSGEGAVAQASEPIQAASRGLPLALGAALVPVFFTYSGWNAAAYMAGEMKEPGRSLPRALLVGTGVVALLYLLINLVLHAVLGTALAGTATPGADAARVLIGPGAERAMSAIIAAAILGSANVTLMAGSRVYYAMARDGLAPRILDRTNRRGAPSAALWAGGAWAALLAATAGVEELVSWTSLAILLLSSLTVASLFVFRRRDPDAAAYRCWGYPFTPWIYLLACLGVAVASLLHDPRRALWGVLLVGAGFPLYPLARRWFGSARPR